MSRINFLPPWAETNLQPAFYDVESGTCLQQTARMYNKVNELTRIVNELDETVADYIQQFIDLRNYVEDYFANLDVQEEINTKLDEMAENGQLSVLLNEQYDELRDEVNTQISDIERRVQSANSGTPLVASSVGGMTDTSRVYVNTSDGKWYYYDGDSWEIGGTYQATAIADNTVSPIKTTYAKRTHQLFNKNDYNVIRGQAGLDATVISANSNSRTLYIPCEASTTYHIVKKLGSRFGIFTTENVPASGVAVSHVVNGTGEIAVANQHVDYTTPAGANYLCVFYYNTGADTAVSESQVADTIMISKGSTDYGYEPYAYLDINGLLDKNSISRNKLNLDFLCYHRGAITFDFANNKVKVNGLDRLVDEDYQTIYSASAGVATTELTFSASSGLFVLSATVSGTTVTSYQLEAFDSRNTSNKLILLIDRTYKTFVSYYDYGDRIIKEARNAELYHGKLQINLERRKIYFSSDCVIRYINDNGNPTVAYNFFSGFTNEVDIPTSGTPLQALTATISTNTVTSLQFEPYNNINTGNHVILYIEPGYNLARTWYAPYNYGDRITGCTSTTPEMVSMAMFNSIGAIGDSYTQGSLYMDGHWYNSPNKQGSYIGILGRMNGTNWNNYGAGGTSTKTWLTHPNGLAKVLNTDPDDFYFLALGINDAQQGSSYLGSIADITEDYTQNPDTFYGNYARIIEQVQAHAPLAKFVMVGCMRSRNINSYYNTYTNAIKEIAEHYNIPFIDPFDDAFFNSDIMTSIDGTSSYHPTYQGYCGIALALQRLFSKCVETNYTYFLNSNEGSSVQS